MVGLLHGRRPGERRVAFGLLAEIAPDRRPGGADRLAQRLRRDMPVALIDRDRVRLDDEVLLLVLLRPRQRRRNRGGFAPDRSAVEVQPWSAV
jgi:hypothetical protein